MRNTIFLKLLIFFCVLLNLKQELCAQSLDTTSIQNMSVVKHSPAKASILSAVLPGLGQVYNKKIWKVPVIYVCLGSFIYYADKNNGLYKKYKTALQYKNDSLNSAGLEFSVLSEEELLKGRDYYRRNRDLCIIGTALVYILNVVDANVDANLFDFDVSDNLSLRIEPVMLNPNHDNSFVGMMCKIKF